MHPENAPTTDGPNFIDQLPPEVADTVCSYLPHGSDIANVRLLSRFWANVVTPRLLTTVHLIFHPDSFERLTAISRHPVISQHVTHLFYEPDALAFYESQADWEFDLGNRSQYPTIPGPGASEREYRAYKRACVKHAQDPLQHDKKDQGYIEYQRLFLAQEQLREQDYGLTVISDAFSRLRKLTVIITSLGCSFESTTPYLLDAFKPSLLEPYGDHGHGQPPGVPQLRSLLLASHHTQLTKLIIGDVNWQFLRGEADSMNMIKQSLRHLRVLDLMISTGYDFEEDEPGPEIPECREYLANDALCDFVKAAPELERLSIAFDCYTTECATQLKHIVCDHQWTKLKRVEFEKIDATQADFASFFSRHASTLRHLGLKDIRLLERGEWVSTMQNIRKTLSLDTASFGGSIFCEDLPQYWPLDASVWEDDDDPDAQGNVTSEALSTYLVHGGTCPLLDEEEHPNHAI